ncbi:hypothetical protein NPA07_00920 [Mycoplasmopsis caviae]|uniref:Rho termination factor N-terminal domain-containing protein n=1 Tax=Mycoplasmopsis caviae TaxID=55603 RepID=A0A3P8LAK0_9BACT|nr:hypothetical protein [Mycoplasmopsis caviae]UUD35423.1 hypothetical protein NPA07_00920 [Mycoplasmopsis caviae]VDR41801.1 Uncharacterised protein [Mycoplasmopsis caviae]
MNLFDKKYLEIKSAKKLWSLEKERFRPVIILSLLAFIISFVNSATITTLYIGFKDSLVTYFFNGTNSSNEANSRVTSMIIVNGLVATVMLVSIIIFTTFYLRTFKEKTFINMHIWPSTLYFFSWLVNFYSIDQNIRTLINKGNTILLAITITMFLINVILLVFQFLFVNQLKYFKLAFINAKRLEELKKVQDALKQSGMLGENNAFNNLFGINLNDINDKVEHESESSSKDEEIEEAEIVDNKAVIKNAEKETKDKIKKLLDLPNSKLYSIAETLYISGYKKMDKEELCRLIVQIVDSQKAKEDEEANKDKDKEETK